MVIVALLLILAGGMWGYRAYGTQQDLKRWHAYEDAARARGEDLGIEAWLPPKPADAENLFTHPWMLGFLSGKSSLQATAVAALNPDGALQLDDYQYSVVRDDEIARSWFEDKPAERDRVLEAGRAQAADLAAIREMVMRPHARVALDLSKGYDTAAFESLADVSGIGTALGVHADAALAAGDEASAVADLETMLRLRDHLRGQNFFLLQVVGVAMEAKACNVIEAAAKRKPFSPEAKQSLRAARRSRKLEDEFASTWRVERGVYLKTLDEYVAKTPRTGLRQNIMAFFYQPDRMVATNSLFLCEMLDPALIPAPSAAGWQDFAQRVELLRNTGVAGGPDALARATLAMTGGLVGSFYFQEEEIDRVFKLLDP